MVQKSVLGPHASPVTCLRCLQRAPEFNRKAIVRYTANIATGSWDVALLSLGMAWKLVSAVGGMELRTLVSCAPAACSWLMSAQGLQAIPIWHELNRL